MMKPMLRTVVRRSPCVRIGAFASRAIASMKRASSLDEFEIDFGAQLGFGTFGAVYGGQHRRTSRDVAIKAVSSALAPKDSLSELSDLKIEDGVFQERQVFSQILESGATHPNVVELVGCFEGPGEQARRLGLELPEGAVQTPLHYFVMERLEGKSLQEHIEESGGLQEEEVKTITRSVCDGLQFLHSHGIVHRDIKPGNIMFSHDSSTSTLKLIDFSHAGVTSSKTSVELAVFNKRLGTAGYAAPEVLLQTQPYSAKCDVYSLGCTVHAMLANMRLPRRHPRIGIMTRWPEKLSPEGRKLLDACLSLDPEDRPSIDEILNDRWLR